MQAAFNEYHGLQCGFCTPGMIMTGVDMVRRYRETGRDLRRGRDPPRTRGQHLSLHGLSQHRPGDRRRGEGDVRAGCNRTDLSPGDEPRRSPRASRGSRGRDPAGGRPDARSDDEGAPRGPERPRSTFPGYPSLRAFGTMGGAVEIGAMTTHSEVAGLGARGRPDPGPRLAGGAHRRRPVRHRGTIGGSLANKRPGRLLPRRGARTRCDRHHRPARD